MGQCVSPVTIFLNEALNGSNWRDLQIEIVRKFERFKDRSVPVVLCNESLNFLRRVYGVKDLFKDRTDRTKKLSIRERARLSSLMYFLYENKVLNALFYKDKSFVSMIDRVIDIKLELKRFFRV